MVLCMEWKQELKRNCSLTEKEFAHLHKNHQQLLVTSHCPVRNILNITQKGGWMPLKQGCGAPLPTFYITYQTLTLQQPLLRSATARANESCWYAENINFSHT